MIELGINIDHVATLRQARKTYEPDPVWAAVEAQLGGADGITFHLREDRRHIHDDDARRLCDADVIHVKRNMEMSLAEEIVAIACDLKPDQATLVPERREEVTTEGGLDLAVHAERTAEALKKLKDAGVFVSAFIDPDPDQVDRARELGFDAVELHTGAYANAGSAGCRTLTAQQQSVQQQRELARLITAGQRAVDHNLRLHAGHGLNYTNTPPVAAIGEMAELNIGHAIISRAVFIGLRNAVRQMKDLL